MKKYIKIYKLIISYILITFIVISCSDAPIPKPRGYFRIAFPKKEYIKFDSLFPYSFEYPVYSNIESDKNTPNEPYFININFPRYNGTLHISYKKINKNLNKLIEDCHIFVNKHIPKASSIDSKIWADTLNHVYGLTFDIGGIGVASPYQFYLTDSTTHFLRAALYFNEVPNNDSLSPVIKYIKEDLTHLIETFKWKHQLK
jgi:gliding motility-associated lipoprotein GldD